MLELVNKEDVKKCIIRHHTKYKEIHGEDKTMLMSLSKHQQLHIRLRKEGKCKIPAEKLAVISDRAAHRIEKPSDWIRKQVIKDIEMKKR